MKIHKVKAEDLLAIGHIQRETWIKTYEAPGHGVTKKLLADYTKDWDTPKNTEFLLNLLQQPHQKWLAAEIDKKVVGHLRFLEKGGVGEIDMFYILPEFQGRGIGRKLFATATQDFAGEIIVDVVDYNQKAQHFYQKLGFLLIGAEPNTAAPLPNGVILNLVRMKKPA